jgi:hypothetical protein
LIFHALTPQPFYCSAPTGISARKNRVFLKLAGIIFIIKKELAGQDPDPGGSKEVKRKENSGISAKEERDGKDVVEGSGWLSDSAEDVL